MITNKTFQFLKDLKKNNNRDWFSEHKAAYEASNHEVIAFADHLHKGISEFDQLETPNGKKSLFRIYRDIRFSKDKTPYKTNRSGSFARLGVERRGGYYFSIAPGETVVGGGFYGPTAADLKLIRQQIELDAEPLRAVLNEKEFKSYYGSLQGEKLKTHPRGFDPGHEAIDLLRHKHFFVMRTFKDKEVLQTDFPAQVLEAYKKLLPFFEVMSMYLTTNLDGESIV
jgi:uncharacterized protein (TIGR02453 family)